MDKDKGHLNANAIGISFMNDTVFIALFDQSPRDNSKATIKASIALNVETVKGLIQNLSTIVDMIETGDETEYTPADYNKLETENDSGTSGYIQPITGFPFKQ